MSYKICCMSIFGAPCPGATKKWRESMIWYSQSAYWRLSCVETVCISKDRVGHTTIPYIHHKIFGMKKLSARRLSSLFPPDNKLSRETTSQHFLTMFKCSLKEFPYRFVTIEVKWVHWNTPEIKEQSNQCCRMDFSANLLLKGRKLSCRSKRWRPPYSEIHKVYLYRLSAEDKTVPWLYSFEHNKSIRRRIPKKGLIWRRKSDRPL